jgi:hypothetical protein
LSNKDKRNEAEDKVISGYLLLSQTILEISPQLKAYMGDAKTGYNFTEKLFNYLFEMPTIDNKESNLPLLKNKIGRTRAFNLLLSLCQSSDDNKTFEALFK